MLFRPQQRFQQLAVLQFIVDDQDGGAIAAHGVSGAVLWRASCFNKASMA